LTKRLADFVAGALFERCKSVTAFGHKRNFADVCSGSDQIQPGYRQVGIDIVGID